MPGASVTKRFGFLFNFRGFLFIDVIVKLYGSPRAGKFINLILVIGIFVIKIFRPTCRTFHNLALSTFQPSTGNSPSTIGPDPVDAKIWIDPESFDVHRAILTEFAGDAEKERTWQIDFWDFGNTVEIEAPEI